VPRATADAQAAWVEHLRSDMDAIYGELTNGYREQPRVSDLVYAAAKRFPEQLPSRAAIEAERELLQKDKQGLEISQGIFVAHVLAHPRAGFHLMHSMSQPTGEALARLEEFRRTGSVDLGPMRVDRDGDIGHVTVQNHAFLNSEDDVSTAALEVAVDLVLLDESTRVGVLRGGPATHHKYAGRRILGSGINLTHLYKGKISLVEFMLERELGQVSKMYRGHDLEAFDAGVLEHRREKPWIAAVDSFAIGGTCQWLLVMDYVIAETGSYFVLPARKEGIIPGCANLRLPRFVGERIARQALFFNRSFPADSPEGLMLADEVVPAAGMDAAIRHAASEVVSAGTTSLTANRLALRQVQEPLGLFRRYMSNYARQQAYCLYSPALIDNLERNWNAKNR
jgi:(3,5-dihydroxyphenyl)acetyl-CoA 1,2-dioxygenase